MFSKILIANRGEIACRIIDTCRRLNIATVTVFSDADRSARHVSLADEAVAIGPPAPAESYLAGERIIRAAHTMGVEAIHPGYGFLSENPAFAEACETAGLVFVGPRSETIRLMGSKSRSKELMVSRGIPTVPGYHGSDQTIEILEEKAQQIGFPLMIKASAGGGGKGMRIVKEARVFQEALRGARREARGAFGGDAMILEKYLERPRHIEFQIFGDQLGNLLHINERECSIQRRYQKIIEETPSPFLNQDLRKRMAIAAVEVARAVNYVNAGTVEFIVSTDRDFYFMEMNTRLQVEHPVTEMVTGLDLVEWQLRVASGEALPVEQADIASNGHAIEVRVYAEDPYRDFVPSTGRVSRFAHPEPGRHLRVDSGIRNGDQVSMHYDPMIAKLTVWDQNRASAVGRLRSALAETAVFGPVTNLPLLRSIIEHRAFGSSQIDTGYIDTHLERLLGAGDRVPELALIAAACQVMLDREAASQFTRHLAGDDAESPWNIQDGWQLNGRTRNRFLFLSPSGARHEIEAAGWDGTYACRLEDKSALVEARESDEGLALIIDGKHENVPVIRVASQFMISASGHGCLLRERPMYAPEPGSTDEEAHPGSPLPGRIVALEVREGDRVEAGQALLVVEGMKMEYTLRARATGTVEKIHHKAGDMVEAEVPLIDIIPG